MPADLSIPNSLLTTLQQQEAVKKFKQPERQLIGWTAEFINSVDIVDMFRNQHFHNSERRNIFFFSTFPLKYNLGGKRLYVHTSQRSSSELINYLQPRRPRSKPADLSIPNSLLTTLQQQGGSQEF
ncbi:hypothetical protein CEXT_606801 [Caerostris extrusa]|uniref:Uncharacterized protein n=1 Tax=Caerostris extrusa TaxID=172846 RepID=A0AAV4UJ74_CAEEX|nr:hypothetical protein CEXT_606801 [Caerostris extrusa]